MQCWPCLADGYALSQNGKWVWQSLWLPQRSWPPWTWCLIESLGDITSADVRCWLTAKWEDQTCDESWSTHVLTPAMIELIQALCCVKVKVPLTWAWLLSASHANMPRSWGLAPTILIWARQPWSGLSCPANTTLWGLRRQNNWIDSGLRQPWQNRVLVLCQPANS